MVKEAKLWQEQAESDFEDAKLLWDNHRYGAAVLFYQQSVEKLIKAYIVSHKNLAPKKTIASLASLEILENLLLLLLSYTHQEYLLFH